MVKNNVEVAVRRHQPVPWVPDVEYDQGIAYPVAAKPIMDASSVPDMVGYGREVVEPVGVAHAVAQPLAVSSPTVVGAVAVCDGARRPESTSE